MGSPPAVAGRLALLMAIVAVAVAGVVALAVLGGSADETAIDSPAVGGAAQAPSPVEPSTATIASISSSTATSTPATALAPTTTTTIATTTTLSTGVTAPEGVDILAECLVQDGGTTGLLSRQDCVDALEIPGAIDDLAVITGPDFNPWPCDSIPDSGGSTSSTTAPRRCLSDGTTSIVSADPNPADGTAPPPSTTRP